jgi:small subunit ribosomal protein S18
MTSKKNKARLAKESSRRIKKKSNPLPGDKVEFIDYKDINLLQRFMTDRSKIRGRRLSGADQQQQREITNAIKNAREMALLPYTKRVTSTRAPRGERRDDDAGETTEQSIDAKYAELTDSTLEDGIDDIVETAETVEA